MEQVCIGVDVGGTSVKMGMFRRDGHLLKKWEIPTRTQEHGAYILEDVAASVQAACEEAQAAGQQVIGVGMGVLGPVESDGHVEVCVNLGWKDRFPARELSGLLGGLPVFCGNDANVAALGEMWQGGGKG